MVVPLFLLLHPSIIRAGVITRQISEVCLSPATWEKCFVGYLKPTKPQKCHVFMHQSIPPASSHTPPPHSRATGICQPRGHSRAFDAHRVSYHNITKQRVLLGKKHIGSSVKDRNKLKRVVKARSWFYACISSLLIKPKLHSEIGAIDVNRRFLVIKSNFC